LNIKGVVPAKYIMANYSYLEITLTLLLSTAVATLVAYPMLIRYSRKLTLLVFKTIPAESLYGLFLVIVVLLAYYDAGLRGVLGVFMVSIVSGILWRNGVSLGVLFMTLVAAPTLFAFIKLV
jgi:putative tricarboxylic transport membrane protein